MVEVRCPWLPQLSLFRIFGPPLNPILTPFWPHEIAFWPYEMPLNPTNISLTPMKSHEFPPFQPIIPPHEANRPYGQQEGTRAVLQGTLKRGIKSSKHSCRLPHSWTKPLGSNETGTNQGGESKISWKTWVMRRHRDIYTASRSIAQGVQYSW